MPAVLRIALGRAVKAGHLVRNVATLVDPPRKAPPRLRPLSGVEVRRLIESTADDRLAALYVTAVGLGLRQGELLGLRWQDVDLDAGKLTVRHSLARITGELSEPKTERSRRLLTMPPTVTASLREHRRRQAVERLAAGSRWQDGGYVFTTRVGTPLDHRNALRAFQAALAKAGLPLVGMHMLRHSAATLMLEQGEELVVVSKMLGHSTLSTTADIFAHFTESMRDEAATRMETILAG